MTIKIGIVGSCATDDVFRTPHNYKFREDFEKIFVIARTSIISLSQEKPQTSVTKSCLNSHENEQYSEHNINCMYNDLNKTFYDFMSEDIEYLLVDLYFDVIFGILITDKGIITNNYWHLPYTNFYKNLKKKEVKTIYDNPNEFMEYFKLCSDKFFNFMKSNYPNTKIIINCLRIIDKKLDENGKVIEDYSHVHEINKYNPGFEMLEKYLEENYDVFLIRFEETALDDNHIWGPGIVHYDKKYYQYVYRKLLSIIHQENIKKLKNETKNLQRENNCLNLKIDKLNMEIASLKLFKDEVLNSKSWKITKPFRDLNLKKK